MVRIANLRATEHRTRSPPISNRGRGNCSNAPEAPRTAKRLVIALGFTKGQGKHAAPSPIAMTPPIAKESAMRLSQTYHHNLPAARCLGSLVERIDSMVVRSNVPHERRGHPRLSLALYRSRGARCGC